MKSKKLITILSLTSLVIAAAFGAVAYRSAKAASASASQAAVSANSLGNLPERGRGPGGGYINEELATALGITVDELTAAQQKAQAVVLDQAVEKGLITKTQADQLKANGSLHMRGLLNPSDLQANGIDYETELATALGITVEKLQAAYTQAFNAHVDQAVSAGTLTQEQADLMKGQNALYADQSFRASMKSAYEAAVAQAVKDGVITQAQADLILKNTSAAGFDGFKGLMGKPSMGGFEGGHGGHQGDWDNAQSAQPAESTTP
jgi:polyhydroxyalkanoate synthesis regulator phasin